MTPNEPVFSHLSEIGVLELRPLNIKSDSITIHQWVTQKYAYYWGMSGYSISHVAEFYQSLLNKTN
ncbi:MAG: acetyltransferase, partial [Kangiellaceae bacterium]|nr:acetyltransferase [Kangiellaceae bacterium]